MFKKYFILFMIFSVFTFSINLSSSLSNKQKWLILENFKKKEYEIIFETDFWLLDDGDKNFFNIKNKIDIYENIKNKTINKKKYAELQKERLINKVISLEDTIKILSKDIEEKTKHIKKINSETINIKKRIESNKKIVSLLRKKISEHREILLDYMVYIYKKWNSVSSKNDIDNLKTIILSNQNISDLIDNLHFKWIIEVSWKKLIDEHRNYINELYIKKLDLEKQEINHKEFRRALVIEKKILNDKKKFKEKILKDFKWKQNLYEKSIKEKIEIEKKIRLKQFKEKLKFEIIKKRLFDKYECEFVDISKNTIKLQNLSKKCFNLNKIIHSESKLKWFKNTKNNIFIWPIFPQNWIWAYFNDVWYKKLFWSSHKWIDIWASQWTNVRAALDGYVIHISKPVSENYSYIALKHSDWFITTYWHINQVLVDELDFVEAWDIIAKSWWEYWTNGAWIITTWPHLHFEVFHNKNHVDPLNFLDTSVIPFDFIPSKYKFKFYSDFRERKWYEYKNKKEKTRVFSLKWDNEIERQQNLINKYATETFSDWEIWIEESLDGNIDPTFVMCIWLAETWLWRNMKSPYNVWNVWNTDSWATKAFKNARSWIYFIVQTLNNKILWWYNKIKDLSRYGNKDWPIYASSPDYWHNNIIKCMSTIKWKYVEDSYNFRLIR